MRLTLTLLSAAVALTALATEPVMGLRATNPRHNLRTEAGTISNQPRLRMQHFDITDNNPLAANPKLQRRKALAAAGWEPMGTGLMSDGWIIPAYGQDPVEWIYYIDVYQQPSRPGIYGIDSPYVMYGSEGQDAEGNTLPALYSDNANKTACFIEIDTTDPDFVTVPLQYSGFTFAAGSYDKTATPIYIYESGYYFENKGNSRDQIVSQGYNSTMKSCSNQETGAADYLITIPYPMCSTSKTEMNGAQFMQDNPATQIEVPQESSYITPGGIEPDPGEKMKVLGYEYLGTGTMTDCWIVAGFDATNPADWQYTFHVFESKQKPGLFILQDPFTHPSCVLNSINEDANYNMAAGGKQHVQFTVDCTDPNFVTIRPQYSGVTVSITEDGETYTPYPFWVGNSEGFYASMNYDKETAHSKMTQGALPFTEFTEHPLTGARHIELYPSWFGSAANSPYFGEYWVDENNNPYTYCISTIDLPGPVSGISDIRADEDATAPVELYNLQGQRVTNPQAGQLLIKRQGTKAYKTIAQ